MRLKNYNYSLPNAYFVTICTKNRECSLGKNKDGGIVLSDIGKIAKRYWLEISNHFPDVILDEFVIMPNHVHGILIIYYENLDDERVSDSADHNFFVDDADLRHLQKNYDFGGGYDRTKMLLSKVIHGFKSSVTRTAREGHEGLKFLWQRSFYDHIICSERSIEKIREYIRQNSLNWQLDIENKKMYSKMSNRDLKKILRKNLFIKTLIYSAKKYVRHKIYSRKQRGDTSSCQK